MSGLRIIGSGIHVPGRPYTNHDLARVMDTNDAWVRQRTGIVQRRQLARVAAQYGTTVVCATHDPLLIGLADAELRLGSV